MKQIAKIIGIASLVLISGCSTTLTSDAQQVVLHTQLSAILSNCKKLGNVSGEFISKVGVSDDDRQQAINNMRDTAYKQYHADTVALVNVDELKEGLIARKVVAQGLAFKCN